MKFLKLLLAPFKWIKRHFFKLTFICLATTTAYLVYLDAQIQPRFEGNKWQVPAQIYARPLVLEKKQEISIQEIEDELELLGYRLQDAADEVGEYSKSDKQLIIYRREFYYPDNIYPAQKILIGWEGDKISTLARVDDGENFKRTSLEPWLVSRLVGGLTEDRMLMSDEYIPPLLKIGLIVVEDKNFYSHHGVAPLSIVRALIANISAGRTVQGGSTLTQQLVKNLFLTRNQTYIRKLREAAMAIVIDARYSKEEILNAYINEVFLGQNGALAIHGFGLASHYYFNKPLDELEIHEIAVLVGLVKGPSYYDPKRHVERMTTRRDLVLRLLFEANEINRIEYETAINLPLETHNAPSLASGKHPAFMDKVRQELSKVVQTEETRLSGVKVFTTLDINAQRRAENAVTEVVAERAQKYKQKDLQAALVMSDIRSGGIRAMVGGKNTAYAGFNRALNASRPIGSLMKPVVYLRALEQPESYNLASLLEDKPISYDDADGKKWAPLNADKEFRGQVSLMDAIVKSYNVPTVNLAAEVGFDEVVETLNRLGANKRIKALPSIALGAVELTPLQVNQVYQTLSNNGELRPLYALQAVSSHEDELIWKRNPSSQIRADEDASYLLNYALHKVTLEGTARSIKSEFPNINMAGKTGTTDDYRDSWFAGFDRNLVTSVWLGNDDNQPINMSGATGALRVYIALQKKHNPKTLVRRFPDTLTIAHFDSQTGVQTLPGCPNVVSVPAVKASLLAPKPCAAQPAEIKQTIEKEKSWWEKLFS
ncbi:penicillin-binding protein 1B [Glaciecola petra]|uniref:Penicillin-binding protein 1B n=1 Tax=Glaciecola petra TaxID=3075602 RepID=A0ABU2ZSJ1_9ALTE|nr:penicillin-binding protein 1B [Aestuariibacter sp. P117]MDT0595603.1 penicillin-binding protein 1B [Aestuariibacter sp. P117]